MNNKKERKILFPEEYVLYNSWMLTKEILIHVQPKRLKNCKSFKSNFQTSTAKRNVLWKMKRILQTSVFLN